MRLLDEAHGRVTELQLVRKDAALDNRAIEFGLREGVGEPIPQALQRRFIAINGYGPVNRLREWSKLIDPMHMVAMVVGDDQRIDLPDTRGEQLLAKIGPTID